MAGELHCSQSIDHDTKSNLGLGLRKFQVLSLDAQTYIRLHYDSMDPFYAMDLT